MQRWRHICTNRPPPDHLRATYAQPARRCVPSHARPAMMNVIHVSQRCQRLVGNYVSAGRGFRWHLLGTNPPRTPGPQRETAASSRAAARISRKPTHLGTKPPRASAPQHPTAAGCSVRARNRRGHARFVQIRLHPSRRPPHCRRSRASDMQRWHHICTHRPPPAPFGPHTGSPDLHGRAPSTRSRFAASIAISSATRSRHRRRDHDSRPRSRSRGRRGRRRRRRRCGRCGRHEPRLRYSTGLGDVGTHASVSRPPSQPRNAMPVITPQTMKPA